MQSASARLFTTAILTGLGLSPLWAQDPRNRGKPFDPPTPRSAPDPRAHPRYLSDEVLVRFRGDLDPGSPEVVSLEAELRLEPLGFNPWIAVHRYRLPDDLTLPDALRSIRFRNGIDFVEPHHTRGLHLVPNDTFYRNSPFPTDQQRWVFNGIGIDRNLDAEAAWDLTTGRSEIVIAIVDSGVDLDHPDLAANLWENLDEIADNGLDDDNNGFIDDRFGYDFQSDDGDPNPDLGDGIDNDGMDGPDSNVFHGTYVASLAGAAGNNAFGLAGAAFQCRIMTLKVLTDDGAATDFDLADAITYAANEGAHVLNLSLGQPGFSSTLQAALAFARSAGVVQIASAGNGNSASPMFPAAYTETISVGATDSGSLVNQGSGDIDGRADFTQFGFAAVDLVAPGADVFGASIGSVADGIPGESGFTVSSGTSASAPLVAGLAVLLHSRALDLGRTLSVADVEAILLGTALDLPDDPGDTPNGGAGWDGAGRAQYRAAVLAVEQAGGNSPPVADAGPDLHVDLGELVLFDGGGSSDPDQDPLEFEWTFGDGSPPATGETVEHTYSTSGEFTATLTVSDGQETDTDSLLVSVDPETPPEALFFFTLEEAQLLPGAGKVHPEDVTSFDLGRRYRRIFDGSDVGLDGVGLDGLSTLPDGDLLLTFAADAILPSFGPDSPGGLRVSSADIVRFTPARLGEVTSGVFSLYFDGSDVGFGPSDRLDAISRLNGDLILSPAGSADLLRFTPTSLGQQTAGSFSLFFDGSDVGLDDADGNLDAVSFLQPPNVLLFSTSGAPALQFPVADEDLLRFRATSLGETTSGTLDRVLAGGAIGMGPEIDLTGLWIAR